MLIGIIVKKSMYIDVLLLIFMWALCTFCNYSYDLNNYRWLYENYLEIQDNFSPIFNFIFYNAAKNDICFTCFKSATAVFSIGLIYFSIKKYAYYSTFVLALFIIYVFWPFITQIRGGMAAAISIYALLHFLQDPKHNIWKYCLTILIAILIHWSSIFYLLFAIVKYKIIRRFVPLITFVVIMFSIILMNTNIIYLLISKFIKSPRILQYFDYITLLSKLNSYEYNWKSVFMLCVYHITVFCVFSYIVKQYKARMLNISSINIKSISYKYTMNYESLNMIHSIVILYFTLLPTYFYPSESVRLLRNILPVFYVLIAQYLYIIKEMIIDKFKKKDDAYDIIIIIVIYTVIVFLISLNRSNFEIFNLLNNI